MARGIKQGENQKEFSIIKSIPYLKFFTWKELDIQSNLYLLLGEFIP